MRRAASQALRRPHDGDLAGSGDTELPDGIASHDTPAMVTFQWIIALLLGAALLASLARRVGAPYPTFLALGGVALAFVPSSPNWVLDPRLALTLFVAP